MCEIFIRANPHSYDSLARSLRLHGVATSVRLECLFWEVLEEIGQLDGLPPNMADAPPPRRSRGPLLESLVK